MKNKKSMTIIQLIKEDHKPLKEGIKVLTSEKATEAQKKKALKAFLMDLKLHAKAEEMSLYKNIIREDDVRTETLEGVQEHAIADYLAKQLERSGFESQWSDKIEAKAKVLADLVKHHIEEEEEEMLPEVSELFEREELMRLGDLYTERYKELKAKFSKMPMATRTPSRQQPAAAMLM